MKPSIALPTGPLDWHSDHVPRALFVARVELLREVMTGSGASHAVVHGNGFDSDALFWLTHFTPKLGPAYALIPAVGEIRLLFTGGPGMKPSAQRLTWVENVFALKGIGDDLKSWLASSNPAPVALGLIEGEAMLRSDWSMINGQNVRVAALDTALASARRLGEPTVTVAPRSNAIDAAVVAIAAHAEQGIDIRRLILLVERSAYAAGAQDVRILAGALPNVQASTPPDDPTPMTGPTWFSIFVRQDGAWGERRILQHPGS